MDSDSDVVRRSLEEPTAFAAIFDRHASVLHRFVARRTDPQTADDVVAQAFLVAFERRAGFDLERESAAPWLFGIATRLLHRRRRDEIRMWRALSRLPADLAHDDPTSMANDALDARRRVAALAHVVRSLPTAQRDALLLLAWADLSYEQIAEATGVPIGTVRSRINRARGALRSATGDAHPVLTDPTSITSSSSLTPCPRS